MGQHTQVHRLYQSAALRKVKDTYSLSEYILLNVTSRFPREYLCKPSNEVRNIDRNSQQALEGEVLEIPSEDDIELSKDNVPREVIVISSDDDEQPNNLVIRKRQQKRKVQEVIELDSDGESVHPGTSSRSSPDGTACTSFFIFKRKKYVHINIFTGDPERDLMGFDDETVVKE